MTRMGRLGAAAAGAVVAAGLAGALLGACASEEPAQKSDPAAPQKDPRALAHDEITALADAWWELLMQTHPTWATEVGDHRFDDRVDDVSAAARQAADEQVAGLLERLEAAKARHDLGAIEPQDRLTARVLERELREARRAHALGFATFEVNQMYGQQASFPYFALHQHPMETEQDVKNLVARYLGMKKWAEDHVQNLREGLAAGKVAPRVVVERVIGQLEDLTAASDPAQSVFGGAVARIPATLPAASKQALEQELVAATRDGVLEGFAHYRDFLKNEYLPRAREDVSLSSMAGGAEAYAFLVEHHTTTPLTPDAIHQMGLDELERIEAEMAKLARERGHVGDVRSFLNALMAEKEQYAKSREELLGTFKVALARADKALPSAFGRLPRLPYRVEPMDAQREKDAPAAYYQPGSLQAGRDGVFVANLYRFEERPMFNSAVLAFHEAVPGHHLQIAIGQEVEGLPRFRAEGGATAFVEGWALYGEQLCDELGLYVTLEERVGMLGFAAWRASRLVVDTGLHHKGWTRQHAIDFLAAHTTLGAIDVENEIDRYIVIPGQALAYMVGRLRILALRERVKAAQGAGFDLKAFHDALLGAGPLPLDAAEEHVLRTLGLPAGPGPT